MKKQLLTAIAVCLSLCGYAQAKGTNALSFGISVNTSKTGSSSASASEIKIKNNSYNLGYSHFIKDHTKVGIELSYGDYEQIYNANSDGSKTKNYGGNVSYQKYFPIVKTLFAYAGGRASYGYGEQETNSSNPNNSFNSNTYGLGVYGGVTWFVSKRFAFETSLLSANATYSSLKKLDGYPGFTYKHETTSFNITSQGFIDDLGFKIYLLF